MSGGPPSAGSRGQGEKEHEKKQQGRVQRILRCFVLLLTSPTEVTIEKLTELNNVGRRTTMRDLALLRASGIQMHFDRKEGCYHLVDLPSSLSESVAEIWPLSWQETVLVMTSLHLIGARDRQVEEMVSRVYGAILDLAQTRHPELSGDFRDRIRSAFHRVSCSLSRSSLSSRDFEIVLNILRKSPETAQQPTTVSENVFHRVIESKKRDDGANGRSVNESRDSHSHKRRKSKVALRSR